MRTFLIRFYERPERKPISAALIDVKIGERALQKKVELRGGDYNCPHCRGNGAATIVLERAYELALVPAGNTECDVHDMTDDPRLAEFARHTELPPEPFIGDLSAPVSRH